MDKVRGIYKKMNIFRHSLLMYQKVFALKAFDCLVDVRIFFVRFTVSMKSGSESCLIQVDENSNFPEIK